MRRRDTEQPVTFYSGGLKIAGVLFSPPYSFLGEPRPGVTLCQGFAGVKEIFMPAIARRLAEAGFFVLSFDYRYFGESEGEPRFQLFPLCQVEDTRNAITFLQIQPGVNPEQVGLYGTSFGGAIASYTAAVDSRVKCVVSTMGVGNGERWLRGMRPYWQWQQLLARLEEDRRHRVLTGAPTYVDVLEIMVPDPETRVFWEKATRSVPEDSPRVDTKITLESAEAVIAFKPEEVVADIYPRAAMWVHATRDALVPVAESRAMYQRAREPKALVLIDSSHLELYRGEPFEQLMEHTVSWLKALADPIASEKRWNPSGN